MVVGAGSAIASVNVNSHTGGGAAADDRETMYSIYINHDGDIYFFEQEKLLDC